jgi:peptidoglycan/LPS O-acetylase OafA/YrhL
VRRSEGVIPGLLHGELVRHIRSIDGLRGVAVLGVLFCHLSGNIFILGARGVDLFFVISGFCLGLAALERGFNLRAYVWSRARRILPPFYAAIALGIVIAVSDGRLTLHHALIEGLRNAVFLSEHQGYPTINGMFWTLLVEFRWYFYFPLLFMLYRRSKLCFGALMVFCAVDERWGPAILPDTDILSTFMFGIIAADLTLRKTPLPGLGAVAAISCVVALMNAWRPIDHGEFAWQAGFFLMTIAGIRYGGALLTVAPLAFLGRISYSLYLAQGSALELLSPYHVSPWLAGPAIIGYGYVFYLVFEQRTFAKQYEKKLATCLSLYAADRRFGTPFIARLPRWGRGVALLPRVMITIRAERNEAVTPDL